MKFNLTTALIVLGIVIVTLKFREQLVSGLSKIPVLGPIIT